MKIILYGRIPSKKNSKNIIKRGNRTFIVSSKKYIEWEKEQLEYLEIKRLTKQLKKINPSGPYKIEMNIYLPDKRKTDIDNKTTSVLDLLVKFGLLADDNVYIIPELHIYFKGVDKENPRCEIELSNIV